MQDPKRDVKLLTKFFKDANNGKAPLHVKEDFCGTFYFSAEWILSHPERTALAVDNDWEPLSEGFKRYYNEMSTSQKERLKVVQGDVCNKVKHTFDICFASNFSYNCLKERNVLKKYFAAAYKNLSKNGILVLDHFGGSDTMVPNMSRTRTVIGGTPWYYDWELKSYNPSTAHALYQIHFSRSKTKREFPKTFSYEWRMWSLSELTDIMKEVGFKKVQYYWENEKDNLVLNPKNDLGLSVWIMHLVAIK